MDNPNETQAKQDLRMIQELSASTAFREYFLRRVREKVAARTALAMDIQTPECAATIERHIVHALRVDVLELIARDEAGCRSILGDAFNNPEE